MYEEEEIEILLKTQPIKREGTCVYFEMEKMQSYQLQNPVLTREQWNQKVM